MYQLTRLKLLLFVLFLLQACAVQYESDIASPSGLSLVEIANSLKSQKACIEAGGKWQKLGRLQYDGCVLFATDAGKACKHKAQCEIACITNKRVSAGVKVEGQCHDSTNLFGCRTYVSAGKAKPTLCID